MISIGVEPQGALTCRSSTLTVFAYSGSFRGLLLTFLGSRTDSNDLRTPACVYVLVINTHIFGRFWPVSWTITHRFEVPKRYPWLSNPGVRLHVGHQHPQFWPILACFVDYYSLFSGPGVISIINEPWGAFTCRSSALAVLADSGPFRGLLLTVSGSRGDFHD